ncbi:MAG: YcjF family protein [cyanobacterium endosymbiont of Rhopalodia fuxianensis]
MPLPRLLFLIIGLSIILGLIIWLINSIYRLYIQFSFTAPLLGNLLILLIICLLGLLIYAFIYYFNLAVSGKFFFTRRQERSRPKLPEQKTEAAHETLKAVRRQVQQIQDKVTQKALLSRSRKIETSLAKGDLQVVVFGTGAAGKTSLVNALVGEMVGNVEATLGTTKMGKTYSLKLPAVPRDILITDTPGILEVGVEGTEREQLARKLATEADLLLFVVDNDLRQSEYDPLQTLVNIGKRSLLILNKIDLYPKKELTLLMKQLQQKVKGLISPLDIIAVAAKPQSFLLETNEIVEPEPEIIPLIKRLVVVLRAEGEDLIADNILLQSQRLGEEARKMIDRQRRQQADKIIDRYRWIGAGVISITPLPVVDMLAMAAVNAQMVIEIGQIYGCELNSDRGKELAISLGKTLVSLGIVKGALDLLSKALQLNVTTYLVGKAIQGVTAAYLTRIAGKSFVEYFRHDQDWGDGGITEVVQRQFELSRKDKFVKRFVTDAIARVVEPLTSTWEDDEEEFTLASIKQKATLEEDDW